MSDSIDERIAALNTPASPGETPEDVRLRIDTLAALLAERNGWPVEQAMEHAHVAVVGVGDDVAVDL
jgi:hypothetical protein